MKMLLVVLAIYLGGNVTFGLIYLSDPSILSSISRSLFLAVLALVASPMAIVSGIGAISCMVAAALLVALQWRVLPRRWMPFSASIVLFVLEYSGILALGKIGA